MILCAIALTRSTGRQEENTSTIVTICERFLNAARIPNIKCSQVIGQNYLVVGYYSFKAKRKKILVNLVTLKCHTVLLLV